MVRDASKAQGLRDAGVEVVTGDLDKSDTLADAFSGVDKVFLLTPPNPNQVTQALNGIAAAKRSGVPSIVRLSAGALRVTADAPARVTRSTRRSTRNWRIPASPTRFSDRTSSCRTR